MKRDEKGVVLMIVLWVVVILTVLALEYGRFLRVEVKIAENLKAKTVSYHLAAAGVQRAIYQIVVDQDRNCDYLEESWATNEDGYRNVALGSGYYDVEVTDEEGKIDLNSASREVLDRFFKVVGVVKEERDTIVDSILDWRDEDDLHHLNGAEDSYYESLENPYHCKDGPFDTVKELLLVKGMRREILEGFPGEGIPLSSLLTVDIGTKKININTAEIEVLQAVLGIGRMTAEAIVSARGTEPFQKSTLSSSLQALLGDEEGKRIKGLVQADSSHFTIISRGQGSGRIGTTITATVSRSTKAISYIRWQEGS